MVDKEMLTAISGLLDEKLEQKLEEKLNQKLDEKLKPVYERLDILDADVSDLKDQMKHTRVLLEDNVIPRLDTIEKCYLDTFQRYKERTEQFDRMTEDIKVIKSVVSDHSTRLNKIPV